LYSTVIINGKQCSGEAMKIPAAELPAFREAFDFSVGENSRSCRRRSVFATHPNENHARDGNPNPSPTEAKCQIHFKAAAQ